MGKLYLHLTFSIVTYCDNSCSLVPLACSRICVLSPGSLGMQTLGLSPRVGCVEDSCNIFCKITFFFDLLLGFWGEAEEGDNYFKTIPACAEPVLYKSVLFAVCYVRHKGMSTTKLEIPIS